MSDVQFIKTIVGFSSLRSIGMVRVLLFSSLPNIFLAFENSSGSCNVSMSGAVVHGKNVQSRLELLDDLSAFSPLIV